MNFNNIKAKIHALLSGRYGIDSFGYFLLAAYAVMCVLNAIISNYLIKILTLILALYMFYRIFSKNYVRRSSENRKFLKLWNPIKTEIKLLYDRIRLVKTDRFRKCKHCKAIVKLPNKRGNHTVKCPKCGEKFDVKIL